jgi:hypothetical protein
VVIGRPDTTAIRALCAAAKHVYASTGVVKTADALDVVDAVADLLDRVAALEAGLREALDWADPPAGVPPPNSVREMRPTNTRVSGVDRAPRLVTLRELAAP